MIHGLLYFQYLFCMIFLLSGISAAADDYFSRITTASNGRLTRFGHSPITLYVGSIPLSEELKSGYRDALEESLSLWEEVAEGKVKFKRVDSPNDADIKLKWIYKLMHSNRSRQIGEANLVRMEAGKFHVEVVIFLRDFTTMKLLDCDTLKAAILHELGHALGLWGHSPNPGDVMFYSAAATKPIERDVATLRKVYATPPDTAFHHDAIAALNAELEEDSNLPSAPGAMPASVSEKARLYYLLGTIYADLGDYDAAISNVQKALEMAPYVSEYAARLAIIFDEKGMYGQAIAQYTEAVKKEPAASLYGRLGLLYLLQEDFEKAVQCYHSGLRLNARSSALRQNILAAYHRWGFKLINEERYSEALKVFDMALIYSPFSYILHYDRAIAYSGAKQYEKSIAQYKLVLDIESNFSLAKIGLASALNNLGVQQAQSNAFDKAINLYQEALQWDAECQEAQENIESIYLRLGWEKSNAGNFNAAMTEYQRALTLNPDNADTYNDIGLILYKQERYAEATVEFKKALALRPQFEDAALNLKYTRRSKMRAKFKPVLSICGILMVSCGMIIFSIRWVRKCAAKSKRND
ncbi:tetratricopeptide repeat protein [bacterium]|nr:tetratricopeptide repeat protein [bacterium]